MATMEVSSMRGSVRSVLVVHDDAQVRGWIGSCLGARGFRVLGASSGHEALAVLEEDVPALLVIGVGMPLLSGWKLIEALAHYPDLARIPRLLVGPEESRDRVCKMALALLDEPAETDGRGAVLSAPRRAANA